MRCLKAGYHFVVSGAGQRVITTVCDGADIIQIFLGIVVVLLK